VSDFGDSTPPPDPYQPQDGQPPPPPPPPPPYGQTPYGQQQPPPGQPYWQQPAAGPPPNYLVWAILSTLFCCLPLGVVSIVFASQVNTKYNAGDVAGALDSSNKAKQFLIWSVIAGAVVIVIYLIAIAASGTSTDA